MKVNSYRLNQLINDGTVREVIALPKFPLYVVGKVYWCSYWQKYYAVMETNYEKHGRYQHLVSVTVQWEDGETGKHCTALDGLRDYELILTA